MTGDGLKSDTSKLFDIIDEVNMQLVKLEQKFNFLAIQWKESFPRIEELFENLGKLPKAFHEFREDYRRKVQLEISKKMEILRDTQTHFFNQIDQKTSNNIQALKERVENLDHNFSELEKKNRDWYIQLESVSNKVEKEITGKLEELNKSYKVISVNVDELKGSVLPKLGELREKLEDLNQKYSEIIKQQRQYRIDLDYWAKKVDTVETEIPKSYEELKKIETKLEEKMEKEVITKIEQLKVDQEELFQKHSQLETNQSLSRENINHLEDKLEKEALVGLEELRKKNAEFSEKIENETSGEIEAIKSKETELSEKVENIEQKFNQSEEKINRLSEKLENEVIGELEELKREKDESTDMTIRELSSKIDELSEKYLILSDRDDKLPDAIKKNSKPIIKKEISQELEKLGKRFHDEFRKKIHEMKVEIVKEITKDRKIREDKPSALESVKRALEKDKPVPVKDHTDMLDTFEERDLGRFIEKIDVEGTENGELFNGKSGYFFIKHHEKGYQLFLDKKITNESPHPNIRKIIKPFFEVTNMGRSTYKLTYPALVDWDERTGRGSIIEKGVVIF